MKRRIISFLVACATMLGTVTMGFAAAAGGNDDLQMNGKNSAEQIKFADADKVRAITSSEIVIKFNVEVDPHTLLPYNFTVQEAYGTKEAIAVSDVRLAKKGDIATDGTEIASKEAARQYAVITLAGRTKPVTLYRIKFSNLKSRYGVAQSTVETEYSTVFIGSGNQGVPVTLISNKIDALSNTKFTIYFSENLDKASAENISNYTIKEADGAKKSLPITGIEMSDNKVTITTAPMKPVNYKVKIKNVKDIYGNVISTKNSENKLIVRGITADEAARVITEIESVSSETPAGSAVAVNPNNQIVVDFNGNVGTNATDVTLYTIKPCYGTTGVEVNPIRVDRVDGAGNGDKVILTFASIESKTLYNLKVKDLVNEDGISIGSWGVSFKFASKESTLLKMQAVLATDRQTLNIYFDYAVDSPRIKGDAKIWTDEGINPGALKLKYYSEPDSEYKDFPVHKAWKSPDNPNVLIIRTNTEAFMSSPEKGSQFVVEGLAALFDADNSKAVFASNNAEKALPQISGVMANDSRTATIYFDQAVKINGNANEVFTIGTKESATDADNVEIPVTTASAIKIADNAYKITTNADMAYEKYYLRVADLSKITDASGYYTLKPVNGSNYISVMFVGPTK
jgi:hypothetical protein